MSAPPLPASPPRPGLLASARHTAVLVAIVGAVMAWGFVSQSRFQRGAGPLPPRVRVAAYASVIVVQLLLVRFVAVGLRKAGHRLRDVAGRWSWRPPAIALDAALAVGFTALAARASPWLHRALGADADVQTALGPRGMLEIVLWVLVSIAAGVCEELVFRGYLQEQLSRLTQSAVAGVLLQSIVFGAGHLYQGWAAATITAVYGLAFGVLAQARGSLRPGMAAHALVDILGGVRG